MVLTPDGPDLSLVNQDLELDLGLSTPSLVTLFSDARREVSDPDLPDSSDDPRGFWPDALTDRFGSKLWLYRRRKITEQTLSEIKTQVEDSFLWMRREGIAQTINVSVERLSIEAVAITVELVRGTAAQWPQLWEGVGDTFTIGPIADRFLND